MRSSCRVDGGALEGWPACSTESKPCETLMVEVEPRARAGAKSEGSHEAEVMPVLCLPERIEANVCEVSESHTAKEPSDMPSTSWPAADHDWTSGSNSLCDEVKVTRGFLYFMPDHIWRRRGGRGWRRRWRRRWRLRRRR